MSAPCVCGHSLIAHAVERGPDEAVCECCSCAWYEPTYNDRVFAEDPHLEEE